MRGYRTLVQAAEDAEFAFLAEKGLSGLEYSAQDACWAWQDKYKFALKHHEFEELFFLMPSTRVSTAQPEGVI